MTKKGTVDPNVRLRTPRDVLGVMERAAAGAIESSMSTTTVRLLTRIGAQSLRALDMQRRLEIAVKRRAEEARARAVEDEKAAQPTEPTFEEMIEAAESARQHGKEDLGR
jgi:hypothetical protein